MTLSRRRRWQLALVAGFVVTPPSARADDEGRPKIDLSELIRHTTFGRPADPLPVRPFGWIEATVSTSPGAQADTRAGRVFDVEVDGLVLHQAYLAVERQPVAENRFDFGGKVAALWGRDARLVHARGLLDDQTGEEQFDLLEAKLIARFPVANGLTVTVGKFTTPMGFEVIEAPANLLPSRSYLFGYAIPFTHTGAIATFEANDQWKLTYGLVEGWDSWDDGNSAWTHLAGVTWTSPSKDDSVIVNAIIGAERIGDDHDLRTVVDWTWTHSFHDGLWTTALNADFGSERGAAPDGGDARWWGVAGYVTEKVSDRFSATWRAEWFRDEAGTRLGRAASLFELTAGFDWKPIENLPNLRLRPELRWDHSFDGPFFDDGAALDQISLSLDVLVTF